MSTNTNSTEFSKLSSLFFPIHSNEIKKIVPMGLMMVLITFNFWIGHNSKDIIIISAPESGAEAINFLKVGVFVCSLFFVMAYTWMANVLSQRMIFYIILSFFAFFVLTFAYLIYPNQDVLHLTSSEIASLKEANPHIKWLFPVIGYWGFSLFYIFSEMWSGVVINLLFWQFANQITTVEQSKRFYMLYSMFNGLGTILSGFFVSSYATPKKQMVKQSMDMAAYGETLQEMMLFFAIACFLIMYIYKWINDNAVESYFRYHPEADDPKKKPKVKLSFLQSFKYILKSKYIGLIAVMGISYNVCINLVEVTWKSQVKQLHHTPLAVQGFFGDVTIKMGIITFLISLVGSHFIRKISWRRSALVTPVVIFITGMCFFALTIFDNTLSPIALSFGLTPLLMSVMVGQWNNLLSKSCKYSFFNVTREMSYIPLDPELKVKGKAAVDVMSGRVGKLGGSAIQGVLLFITTGSQLSIAPYVAIILMLVLGIWAWSICSLNKKFLTLAYGKEEEKTIQ
jgi:AAA family ATP:ADP antiporter